jgi:hypothetical protein
MAGSAVTLAAGAAVVAEETWATYPEENASVTVTNATDTVNYTSHGFQTGDGPVRFTAASMPGGVSATTEYYVINTGANSLKIATSRANALAGTAVDITSDGTTVVIRWVTTIKSLTLTVTAVTNATDTITFGSAHGLTVHERVQVSNSGGGLPAGLSANTDYYVIVASSTTIKLATSVANADAGTAIDLTTDGTGTQTVIYNRYTTTSATQYSVFAVLNDGLAIAMTPTVGYSERISHRPGVTKYHLTASLDVFAPVTAYVRGVQYLD